MNATRQKLPVLVNNFRAWDGLRDALHAMSVAGGGRLKYVPNEGNAGDALIAAGSWQFFDDIELRPAFGTTRTVAAGDAVIYGGGGNFVPEYTSCAEFLERCLAVNVASALVMPQTIRFENAPDDATVGGAMYGAQVLAGGYGKDTLNGITSLNASTVKKTTGATAVFTATAGTGTVTMVPYFRMHNQHYSVYWKLSNVPSDPFIATSVQPVPAPESHDNGMIHAKWSGRILSLRLSDPRPGDVLRLRRLDGTLLLTQTLTGSSKDVSLKTTSERSGQFLILEWIRDGGLHARHTVDPRLKMTGME